VAVRQDDVDLIRPGVGPAAETSSMSSRVLAVDYQGNFVKVMLDATGTDEFVAYIPERVFFRPLHHWRRRPGNLAEPAGASACEDNGLDYVTSQPKRGTGYGRL
jgi:hypothetical protein